MMRNSFKKIVLLIIVLIVLTLYIVETNIKKLSKINTNHNLVQIENAFFRKPQSVFTIKYNKTITNKSDSQNVKLNKLNNAPINSYDPIQPKDKFNSILDLERLKISATTRNQYRNLNELIPELNGSPIISIIMTTWRTGSTFLGDLLNSMNGNYYHYEPLLHYRVTQIRDTARGIEAANHLSRLLECNYHINMTAYFYIAKVMPALFDYNTRLINSCSEYCKDAEFLEKFCNLFPLQSMKVTRLRLKFMETLLNSHNNRLKNVKILYLIRDPRAILHSRFARAWCKNKIDCDDPKTLCDDLTDDYYAVKYFMARYPDRVLVLHFEAIAHNPYNVTEKVLKFFNRPLTIEVKQFLDTHTIGTVKGANAYSTYKNSITVPYRWMENVGFVKNIEKIQEQCMQTLKLWEYHVISNNTKLTPEFKKNFYKFTEYL